MHIVADMLRGPVFGAGLAVTARCAVERHGRLAALADGRIQLDADEREAGHLDHTHYETVDGCCAATELYGSVFKPTVHKEIYPFEDLPRSFQEMQQNVQTGIPIVRVAKEMPAAVKDLLRDELPLLRCPRARIRDRLRPLRPRCTRVRGDEPAARRSQEGDRAMSRTVSSRFAPLALAALVVVSLAVFGAASATRAEPSRGRAGQVGSGPRDAATPSI